MGGYVVCYIIDSIGNILNRLSKLFVVITCIIVIAGQVKDYYPLYNIGLETYRWMYENQFYIREISPTWLMMTVTNTLKNLVQD